MKNLWDKPIDILQDLNNVKKLAGTQRDCRNICVVQRSEVPPHQIWVNAEVYDLINGLINDEDKKIRDHDH